jgi:hypothetical protein
MLDCLELLLGFACLVLACALRLISNAEATCQFNKLGMAGVLGPRPEYNLKAASLMARKDCLGPWELPFGG